MKKPFIELQNVSLNYPVYNLGGSTLTKNVIKLISSGTISSDSQHVTVEALKNISFRLEPGDRLGLIGGNGAGKTTLLRLMSGIYHPTSGQINHYGRTACVLGTGFGMEEDATGYENILISGVASGMLLNEVKKYTADIEDFTELGNYLHMPIRTYSAGMRARLAFAITTSILPDILMIDEGIGAGDASFVAKAKARLDKFMKQVSILVLASHSDALIKSFCNKVLYLNAGKIVFMGELNEGLDMYKRAG